MEPRKTGRSLLAAAHKVLIYATHGWGKTTQALHMHREFGKGFIISGEAGLRSLGDTEIDYLPFSSWDGEHDPAKDIYSFTGICKWIGSEDFKKRGYKWVMVDSLTEMSDRLMEKLEVDHRGSKNNFAVWEDYGSRMIGALKWIRDLPYHVVLTALAKDEEDDNGTTHYWPHIKGRGVGKQLCGIFDHVMAGVRITEKGVDGRAAPKVRRFLALDEVKGYHGKVRDPNRNIPAIMECDDITAVLKLVTHAPINTTTNTTSEE